MSFYIMPISLHTAPFQLTVVSISLLHPLTSFAQASVHIAMHVALPFFQSSSLATCTCTHRLPSPARMKAVTGGSGTAFVRSAVLRGYVRVCICASKHALLSVERGLTRMVHILYLAMSFGKKDGLLLGCFGP